MSLPRVVGLSPAGVQAQLANRLVPLLPTGAAPETSVNVVSGSGDYGSWAELTAATATNWHGFKITAPTTLTDLAVSGANTPCLLDVGIGAPPEVAILSGVDISNRQSQNFNELILDVPYLFVPKGSRVAARISSNSTSRDQSMAVQGYTVADPLTAGRPITKAHAFVTPASQRGVSVATGAGWTEVVAATPRAVDGLVLGIGLNDAAYTDTVASVDLAIGAAGSEVVVWNVFHSGTTSEQFRLSQSTFVPLRVPAGTRLSARCSGHTLSMTIHGLS